MMSKRDAYLLEGVTLGVFTMLIVGAFVVSSIGGLLLRSGQSAAVVSAVLVDLTNQNRQEHSLHGLTINPALVEAAQKKANDEASKAYFAHVSPEGIDSWHWFKEVGYNFTYAGENLAVDFSDSATVVSAWMNSPTHRANILDSHYTETGIATAEGMYEGHPTIFVVQEFGTPSHGVSVATIQEQTLPIEPTQIAVATTKQDIQRPKVLGDTIAKPHAVIVATTRANAVAPSTPTISVRMLPDATQSSVVPIVAPASTRYASVWNFFLMSPETTLRYAYYLIAFLVICALFLTTGFEFQRHHMRHVAVAGCLLVAMCGLFFVADRAVFGTTVIAQNTNSSLNS